MFQTLRTSLLSNARCWDADSERSYQDLFDRLDTNNDGKVDVAELRAGLKAMGIFRQGAAQVTPHGSRGGSLYSNDRSLRLWPACFCMKLLHSLTIWHGLCVCERERETQGFNFLPAENSIVW